MKQFLLGVLLACVCCLPLGAQATLRGARAKSAEELNRLATHPESAPVQKAVVLREELERRALSAQGMKRAFNDAVKRPGGLTLAAEAGEQTQADAGLIALRAKKWSLTRDKLDWTTPDGRIHHITFYPDAYGRLLADVISPAGTEARTWKLVLWIRPVEAYYLISVKGPSLDEKGATKEVIVNIGKMPY